MVEIKRKVSLKQKTTPASPPKTDVNLKRKVTLREKSNVKEPEKEASNGTAVNSNPTGGEKGPVIPHGKKFILGIVALLLLAGGIYALLNKEKPVQPDPSIVAVATEPADSDKQQNSQDGSPQSNTNERSEVDGQHSGNGQGESPIDAQETSESSIEEETSRVATTEPSQVSNPSVSVSDEPESTSMAEETIGDNRSDDSERTTKPARKPHTQADRVVATSNSSALWNDLDQQTKEVILGVYGNGADRKESLGELYDELQAKVNEYYRLKYGY